MIFTGTTEIKPKSKRIDFLDGLRGLAISMVVLFHISDHSRLLPSGGFNAVPMRVFWVGVQLFFLISGFVIFMTLERCTGFRDFVYRRWLRLFPAMLVSSIIILAFDLATGLGPFANRSWSNLLPGITFISPSIINTVTGVMIESMDGPYWTIYVEVMFYFVFGGVFMLSGARAAMIAILSLYLVALGFGAAVTFGVSNSLFVRLAQAFRWLGFIYFGWFFNGALFYLAFQSRRTGIFWSAVAFGSFLAIVESPAAPLEYDLAVHVGLLLVVALFAAAVALPAVQQAFSGRRLAFMGFISYPLYLVHNNIMLGLTDFVTAKLPTLPSPLAFVLPALVVIGAAFVIASNLEVWIRFQLRTATTTFVHSFVRAAAVLRG